MNKTRVSFIGYQMLCLLACLLAATVSGQTTFSGPIANSVTWSGTIELTGDVTITDGGKLTIQPGTRIQCQAGRDDVAGGLNSTHIEIIVEGGSLDAQGTTNAPIIFTSDAATPTPGDWYGVQVLKGDLRLANFVIEYAHTGLALSDPDFRFNTYSLASGTIQHCTEDGMTYLPATTPAGGQLVVDGFKLLDNGRYGYYQSGDLQVIMTNAVVIGNGQGGLNVAYMSKGLLLANSLVATNGQSGLVGYQCAFTVQHCTFVANHDWGLTSTYFYDLEVTSSVFQQNGRQEGGNPVGGGLWANYPGQATSPLTITNCSILDQAGPGLALYGGDGLVLSAAGVSQNLIKNNGTGIYANIGGVDQAVVIKGNDLLDNGWAFYNDGNAAIIADSNYWGEPTTTALGQGTLNLVKVYDSRDNKDKGQVLINRWYPQSVVSGSGGTPQVFVYPYSGVTQRASGDITQVQTWSGKVLVTGDVRILENGHLTIQAGTQVIFDPLRDDQASGVDSSLIELSLQGGSLTVQGTAEAPVVFTTALTGASRGSGDWFGIQVKKGDLRLANFVIEYAHTGLALLDPDIRFNTYSLINGTIQRCAEDGMTYLPATTPAGGQLVVESFKLLDNGRYGYYQSGDLQVAITNAVVTGNAQGGLNVSYMSKGLQLANSLVATNGQSGLVGYQCAFAVQHCTFVANHDWGLTSTYFYDLEVTDSVFQQNGRQEGGGAVGGGIWVNYQGQATSPLTIVNCSILDQAGAGLALYGGNGLALSTAGVSQNLIKNNGTGIYANIGGVDQAVAINGNDLLDNGWAFYNDGAAAIIADGNYWGEPTTTALGQGTLNLVKVYDSRDNRDKGQVLINRWYPQSVIGGGGGTPQVFAYPYSGVTQRASGDITQAQTWSGKVLVTGDVRILENGQLTIQPGTQVIFDPLRDDQASGVDSSLIELTLQGGSLTVQGTAAAPVTFTTAFTGALRGNEDWYGIRVLNGDLRLANFVIEYAYTGLALMDPDFRANTYSLVGGTIQRCAEDGMTYLPAANPAGGQLVVEGFKLLDNGRYGYYQSGDLQVVITNAVVTGNAQGGLNVSYVSKGLQLVDSLVATNGQSGLVAYQCACTVQRCTFAANHDWGITTTYYYDLAVSESVFQQNGRQEGGNAVGGGLWVNYQGQATSPLTIVNCSFLDQEGAGLSLYGGDGLVLSATGISQNIIRNNGTGIYANLGGADRSITIANNDIVLNKWEIYNDNAAAIIADGNYWGEPTTTELKQTKPNLSLIFDRLDDASKGQVNIATWKDKPFGAAPVIQVQPQSQSVNPGADVTFTVSATGSLPLVYHWYKNDILIPAATRASLVLMAVTTNMAGSYYCVITNFQGSATSQTALLSFGEIAAAPEITEQPQGLTVLPGTDVSLRVVAAGTPPLTYQWKRNGVVIPQATNAVLNLPKITSEQAGAYNVVVSNRFRAVTSNIAQVNLADLNMFAGVIVSGAVGNIYRLEYADSLTAPVQWTVWKVVILEQNPQVFVDLNSPRNVKRYYRAILQE